MYEIIATLGPRQTKATIHTFSVQAHSASLNFCLPAALQLLHPKGMCLNAALNQIAFRQAGNYPIFCLNLNHQQTECSRTNR